MLKIKEDFVLRSVAGEHILMPVNQAAVDFNGLVRLNDTGVLLYQELKKGTDIKALIDCLCTHYQVDHTTAQKDIEAFLNTLRSKHILDE